MAGGAAAALADQPTSAVARELRARAALARAEERTGTDSWVRPLKAVEAAGLTGPFERPEPDVEPESGERRLPVPANLVPLLPSGALDRGTTVVVSGSTSLAFALLAEVSGAGGWVAIVGLPGVGVLAAHQLGLDLERMVLVPAPGPDGPTVLAALLDGFDAVVVGQQVVLSPADRRRLSARARERGSVLLPTTPWPGAHVVLTAEGSRWEGLGQGYGRLRSRQLTVHRSGRGSAARSRRWEVALPEAPHPWQGQEELSRWSASGSPAGLSVHVPEDPLPVRRAG